MYITFVGISLPTLVYKMVAITVRMSDALSQFSDALWYIPLVLIVIIGIWATIRFKGVQFTKMKETFRVTFKRNTGDYSALRVFFVSMASRIGAGNITGPILAIMSGGPGAIFWMWVFALLGGATSYFETIIAQLYKEKDPEGGFNGGLAYNIRNAICSPKIALAIALLMIAMEYIGFASMEGCTISQSAYNAFSSEICIVIVLILAGLLAFTMAGGFRRVSDVAKVLVPVMVVFWLIICVISMALSKGGVINAFAMIFQCAFNVPAIVGGGVGTMLVMGMRRGILSNEAGLGTTSYISSKADVPHPAMQGLTQAMGVFIDAIVCTITALVILSYGSYDEIMAIVQQQGLDSQPLLQYVFESTLGSSAAAIVAIFVTVFTFSSMIGTFTIGAANLRFVSKKKIVYAVACCVMIASFLISARFASDDMFVILDVFLAITATVNCIVLFIIGKHAYAVYKDYFRQKDEGIEDPVFRKSILNDDTGITAWD